ncbi:MAG: succinate dehydrogenase, cytochrome b556 subunit [Alphaproteobacteria bacterium]
MSSSAPPPSAPRAARPLSPHLQVYKPQITSVMSILHRITGVGLAAALPVLVVWLVGLSQGQEVYQAMMTCFTSPVGKLFLMGWSWAFAYHLCAGIRHLLWDTGRGMSLAQVNLSGWIALAVSTLMTAGLWFFILGWES